jgi:uncharacterized protein with gpF-like domain
MSKPRAIAAALKRGAAVRDNSAAAQAALFRDAQADIKALLTSSSGYRTFHLDQVLNGIDQALAQYGSDVHAGIAGAVRDAAGAATEMVQGAGVPIMYGVTPRLAQAVIDVTTTQVQAVWAELGNDLKILTQRTVLGITDPYEAIQGLLKAFDSAKTWRSSESDAERIMRTEVGRAFSMAGQDELSRAKAAGVDVEKWWLPVDDDRTRDDHREAGDRYSIDNSIPTDEPYEVGGCRLMFPCDPQGDGDDKEVAAQTINCRCVSIGKVNTEGESEEQVEAERREAIWLLREAA